MEFVVWSFDCVDDKLFVSVSVSFSVGVNGWSIGEFSTSKPNETSFNSISIDLFKNTTGGAFDCRLSNDDNDEEDEWDDKRGDDCSGTTVGGGGGGGIAVWEVGCEGGKVIFVLSSFVVDTNGFIFERLLRIVGRRVPFCVDWKRRLSLVIEDDVFV